LSIPPIVSESSVNWWCNLNGDSCGMIYNGICLLTPALYRYLVIILLHLIKKRLIRMLSEMLRKMLYVPTIVFILVY
jgi:hypothetical protein